MEEMNRARHAGRVQRPLALSGCITLQRLGVFNPKALGISKSSFCRVQSPAAPSLPRGQGVGLKVPTLKSLVLSGDLPHSEAI